MSKLEERNIEQATVSKPRPMSTPNRLSSSSIHLRRSAVLRKLQEAGNKFGTKRTSDASNVSSRETVDFPIDDNDTLEVSTNTSEYAEGIEQLPPNASLEDIRAWLDVQCEKELARVDWSSEYTGRAISGGVDQKSDVVYEGLDTKVLDRIRRRKGPRPARFEDLLAPLRLDSAPVYRRTPVKETYHEMAEVIQTWNQHVASVEEDVEARSDLVNALRERIIFLKTAVRKRRSADAHEGTCRTVLHAIHAYRPETADFSTKDSTDLLLLILAHVGFAIPDIDDDLKYLIFFTLVTERLTSAHAVNAERRQHLEDRIAKARDSHDPRRVEKYEKKMRDWIGEGFCHESEIIATRIKSARRRIYLKGVQDLQVLVVLQAAQKLVLEKALASPDARVSVNKDAVSAHWETLLTSLETANAPLSKATHRLLDDALTHCTAALDTLSDMKDINHARVLTRAVKFAGYDVSDVDDAQWRLVVEQRMAHPDTARMMRDAVEGMMETKARAGQVVRGLQEIGDGVEEMREEVEGMRVGYERLEGMDWFGVGEDE